MEQAAAPSDLFLTFTGALKSFINQCMARFVSCCILQATCLFFSCSLERQYGRRPYLSLHKWLYGFWESIFAVCEPCNTVVIELTCLYAFCSTYTFSLSVARSAGLCGHTAPHTVCEFTQSARVLYVAPRKACGMTDQLVRFARSNGAA